MKPRLRQQICQLPLLLVCLPQVGHVLAVRELGGAANEGQLQVALLVVLVGALHADPRGPVNEEAPRDLRAPREKAMQRKLG